ncbi:MAG: endonuclease domain-containing protein [Propionibacteriaceae bacterium]
MDPIVSAVLAESGVIASAAHPRQRSALARLKTAGVLDNPLPGVFVLAADRTESTWLRAVCAWSAPHGVLHAATAAALWLPGLSGSVAEVAHPTLKSRPRVTVTRRRVPGQFVQRSQGLTFATPAYTAVELAAVDDGRAICEALRRRLVTTSELEAALAALAGTDGQAVRRCVVRACLSNPWSYGELRLHRILRAAGVTGWVANAKLRLGGVLFRPDVLFPAHRLVIEFDGRAVHGDAGQFLKDRERQNALVSYGYLVIRFGWEHLDEPDGVVRIVRRALDSVSRLR